MTVDEKGAVVGGENANDNTETSQEQSGGDNANTSLEQLQKELETLKSELSGRDRALTEHQKKLKDAEEAQRQKELESKTVEEQLKQLKDELDQRRKREDLREALSKTGLPSDFEAVLDGKDYSERATKLQELMSARIKEAEERGAERLKAEMLKDVPAKQTEVKTKQPDAELQRMRELAGLK